MNAAPFFLFFLGMERDPFPLPILSVESLRGSLQSLSCWRYVVNQNITMHVNAPVGENSQKFTFDFSSLCSFLASAIQRRQPPCWFWLWHLGLGAGYREDHGQHQMGCWEQKARAEVALRWDCMRHVHLSKHRLTNRLFRTVVKDAKLTLDWPDVWLFKTFNGSEHQSGDSNLS